MSEWVKENAWKLNPAARNNPHRNAPTKFVSITLRYNDLLRCASVSDDARVSRESSDTVLTQEPIALSKVRVRVVGQRLHLALLTPIADVIGEQLARRPAVHG